MRVAIIRSHQLVGRRRVAAPPGAWAPGRHHDELVLRAGRGRLLLRHAVALDRSRGARGARRRARVPRHRLRAPAPLVARRRRVAHHRGSRSRLPRWRRRWGGCASLRRCSSSSRRSAGTATEAIVWSPRPACAGKGTVPAIVDAWETAAMAAGRNGTRVVLLRTDRLLDRAAGYLARELRRFRRGAGGRLGGGAQYLSWIALPDLLNGLLHILGRRSAAGPVNLVVTAAGHARPSSPAPSGGPSAGPRSPTSRRPRCTRRWDGSRRTRPCSPVSARTPTGCSPPVTSSASPTSPTPSGTHSAGRPCASAAGCRTSATRAVRPLRCPSCHAMLILDHERFRAAA